MAALSLPNPNTNPSPPPPRYFCCLLNTQNLCSLGGASPVVASAPPSLWGDGSCQISARVCAYTDGFAVHRQRCTLRIFFFGRLLSCGAAFILPPPPPPDAPRTVRMHASAAPADEGCIRSKSSCKFCVFVMCVPGGVSTHSSRGSIHIGTGSFNAAGASAQPSKLPWRLGCGKPPGRCACDTNRF
jgi:hypothetical protein